MSNVTYQQVSHWRTMPRTTETVVTFAAQWVDECGVMPALPAVAALFRMVNGLAVLLWRY